MVAPMTAPSAARRQEPWRARCGTLRHRSGKAVPLDNDEVLGPVQPAVPPAVAGHVTGRAGGRPHEDARLTDLFDPRLVNRWLAGAVGGYVENAVPDHGLMLRQSLMSSPVGVSDLR